MAGSHKSPSVLRLSVTDRCNLRCRYCMPATGTKIRNGSRILSYEELIDLVQWLCRLIPIAGIKLTGGEPLARKNIGFLIRGLARIPGISEISATTNGSLLAESAEQLAEAGLVRVNVSLDTLDPVRFEDLTRGGRLADTMAGIHAALAAGLQPVKINSVLLADSWRNDVPRLLDLAAELGLELRFIELMRTGTEAAWSSAQLVEVTEVRRWLGLEEPIGSVGTTGGPARVEVISWRDTVVRVGWITPQSHRFCHSCARLRLDSLGTLRRCLMDPVVLPLAKLRSRHSEEDMARGLAQYMNGKLPPASMTSDLPMIAVGG